MADSKDKNLSFTYTEAKAGDVIRSADWNAANQELVRLEKAKVNRQGADTLQGPLTIEAALTVNGNVGIGTQNPGFALQIGDQNTVGSPRLGIVGRGATGNYRQWTLRTGDGSDAENIHKLRLRDEQAKADRLVVDEKGYVGIGTANPADTLDVHGALRFSGNAQQKVYGDSRAGRHAVVLAGHWDELEIKGRIIDWTGGNLHIGYDNAHSNDSLLIGNGKLKSVKVEGSTDLLIDSGKVGIGTSSPAEKLEIKGGKLQLDGNQQIIFKDGDVTNNLKLQLWSGYGLGINSGTLFYAAASTHSWRDNNGTNERMRLTTAANGGLTVLGTGKSSVAGDFEVLGNVGIGTSSPTAKLEVLGSGGGTVDFIVNGRLRSNNNDGGLWVASDRFVGGHTINKIGFWNNNAWRLTVAENGNVGIGTTAPDRGKVQIEGSVNYQHPNGYRYFVNRTDSNSTTTGHNSPYSLYASSFIGAAEFNAFSDLRIKDVEGISNGASDLQTLRQLAIVDYTYRDKDRNGSKQCKKVIGQQVAQVFPQAVDTHTDIVPDIFRAAASSNGWIDLVDHELQTGERVRIFPENSEGETYIVEDVTLNRFKVSLDYAGMVFVYGREVDDFHVVDYDALAMLNVSATQELCRIIDSLQTEVNDLKSQISAAKAASLPVAAL
ncbi:hypothetical protein IQ265_15245 [Nodosilinea sp. LEGE 06152]|uniref:tail fiber domain-containing protein n=1 Tax=Nodosilinea sp. LEGE 06152 TaxID=2777966 RepID=UPI00187EDCE3|nr:tail fiber domain-containing protein [Nodosilinea sp. LEGE 06152]MBE9158172.1 hypothetical protein [Nodosilinea sp. LEGE 06152]